MGDNYQWIEPCPNCGTDLHCYYANSYDSSDVKCNNCKVEFYITLDFKLWMKNYDPKTK